MANVNHKQTAILLEPEQHEIVKRYSETLNISMSELFRELVEKNRDFFIEAIEIKTKENKNKRRLNNL